MQHEMRPSLGAGLRTQKDPGSHSLKAEPESAELKWWQRAVVYEIAALSFQDSNGDGKGDLRGIISRIDYLEWLGIDAVWLTPIFTSPMRDFGYDIADFCNIDPLFGNLADFDELVEQLHARGIRVILDFVPNHTSDQHAWFVESRSSRANPKRDWYVWADPGTDGGPPNNWLSRFGGSAWEWDAKTEQYYYHAFLLEQPDLNWRNPEVRQAMADILRYWLQRGVDGFRFDASAVLAEDVLLRDDPPNTEADESTPPPQRLKRVFTDDRPETMFYIEELRAVVDEFPDRVICGEVQGKTDRIGHFYGEQKPRLHLPLNFALLDSPWDALSLQAAINAYLNAIPKGAWPDWVVGGHDKRRIASKIGAAQARILAMLLLTLKGTAFFYAGDEFGMEQALIPQDQIQDPFEKLLPGYGLNRDPERSPMAWDEGPNGGFTTGVPWLPMEPKPGQNMEQLRADKNSLLWFYRRLVQIRHQEPALTAGDQIPVRSFNDILAYKRRLASDEFLVALNTVHQPRKFDLEAPGKLLISTHPDRETRHVEGCLMLRPDEGVMIKVLGI